MLPLISLMVKIRSIQSSLDGQPIYSIQHPTWRKPNMNLQDVLKETYWFACVLPDPNKPNDVGQAAVGYHGWNTPKLYVRGRASAALTKMKRDWDYKDKEYKKYVSDPITYEKEWKDRNTYWGRKSPQELEQAWQERGIPQDPGPFRGVLVPVTLSGAILDTAKHVSWQQLQDERKPKSKRKKGIDNQS
jgi:hypothetical protein